MKLGQVARRVASAFGTAWQAQPVGMVWWVAVTAVSGLLPTVSALLMRLLLDDITRGRGADRAAVLAVTLGGAGIAAAALPAARTYLETELRRRVGLHMQAQLFTAVNRLTGLAKFENPGSSTGSGWPSRPARPRRSSWSPRPCPASSRRSRSAGCWPPCPCSVCP